jgi:imidazolonepropionase-like amidohydrolase
MSTTTRPLTLAAILGIFALGATACGGSGSGEDSTAAAALSAASSPEEVIAFEDVTVIPMDRERVLGGQTVLVRDGRIAAMGPSGEVAIPDDATTVPGAGRYLVPGIAEMHAHIPSPRQGAEAMERTLFLYAANGVTTVRGMLGDPAHLELRDRAGRGEIVSPRIYTSGPSFNGNSAPDSETARGMVGAQLEAGYDLLKLHPGLSREVYDVIVETAREDGIPYAGHISADLGLDRTLEAEQASIDHLDAYVEALAGYGGGFDAGEAGFFGFGMIDDVDRARITELARATAAAGVWNAPTLSLIEHLYDAFDPEEMARRPEMRYVPEATVRGWVRRKETTQAAPGFTRERAGRYLEVRRELLRTLQASGAGILLASDAPQWWNVPGFSLHHEMRMMVDAGLTPYQVLESGTRNPARYFGTDEWGVIREGAVADLILLDADPLVDIGNMAQIAGIVLRGRWLPAEEIREGLDAIS